MFSSGAKKEGLLTLAQPAYLPPPVRGLNLTSALSSLHPADAVVLDNWLAEPSKIVMRKGSAEHCTGFATSVLGLHVYHGPGGTNKLFATTSSGVYDASTAGAVGAAAIALTNGKTFSAAITTGGGSYLLIGNGVDTIKQYDGAVWSSVAAYGGLATSDINCAEVYKQRLFFGKKGTLSLFYLAPNSVSGASTEYPLGAIFRRGGAIAAIGTWSVDAGGGPDDLLVVATSLGEVAVFSGTDPASSWALKGVFYIGRPIGGAASLYKYGGEILYLCEAGLFPISKALLTAAIDRVAALSERIAPLISAYTTQYEVSDGWAIVSHPDVPLLLVNVPGVGGGKQLVMHSTSKAWSTFSGWPAYSFARMGKQLYYGAATSVCKAWVGADDLGSNITATALQGYNRFGRDGEKQVLMVRPSFIASGPFNYTVGVDSDFASLPTQNLVPAAAAGGALWGTAVWGTAVWSGSQQQVRAWKKVADVPGVYKAFYLQVATKTVTVELSATDVRLGGGGSSL